MEECPIRILIISLAFLLPVNANAYFIDYLKLQYAGEIGFMSLGIGHKFTKKYTLEYFHGYVPPEIGGHEIETFSIKNNYSFYTYERWNHFVNFYLGANLYHVAGLDYQTSRHSNFPSEYYRLGSIRGLFYTGLQVGSSKKSYHFGYFEGGLNDIVITNYYNNPDVIDPVEYISLALGYGYMF